MLTAARSPGLPVYPRLALEPCRGSGSTLVATDGREVLDLYGGHAVAVSGHCHPKVLRLLPPLVLRDDEADRFAAALREVLR